MQGGGNKPSIRAYFLALLLAGLLPIAAFAAVLLVQLWVGQRDQVRTAHEGSVQALAAMIEREVEGSIRRLEVLAASPLLRAGRIDEFRALSRENFLARSPDWDNILMVDSTGRQVFNLAVEPGQPLPPFLDRPHRRAAVDTVRPVLSDLFVARTSGKPVVEIAVPVVHDAQVRYVLSATLNLENLALLLTAQTDETKEVVALVDREHRIVARTRETAAYIGKHPVPELLAEMQRAPRGWSRFVAFEGDAVYSAWAPVPNLGWSVAFGMAAAPIEQNLTRSLALLGGLGLLVLLASGWLAIAAARRISAGIDSAAGAAQDLAAGREVSMPATRIKELDVLGESLRDAGVRLAAAEGERAALLERERDARAYAEAQNRAKDEFLAMLGHELRNPLSAIANAARLLERVDRDDPAARQALAVINRQAAHQGRLLDDLLDVARVLTGKIPLVRAPLDLADCVGRALGALTAAGKTARHAIETELRPAWVNGDAARLEQIVANLVGNALKFTAAGGTIRISTARTVDGAVIRVQDSGVGIAPALLPRIFDLFAQGEQDPARPAGGLGIGLTLVRRLAELHGGTAEAESAGEGRGAAFTIRLPAIEQPVPATTARVEPTRAQARRVLVVEDNNDVREMLEAVLATEGHEVGSAADGGAALEAAARLRPDVAIVDIGLPGTDGYQVARALRAQHGPRLRLIALTGYGLAEDRKRSSESGFEAHLVKPVDLVRLAALVGGAAATAIGGVAG